jgi:hypothetical protein
MKIVCKKTNANIETAGRCVLKEGVGYELTADGYCDRAPKGVACG